MKNSKSISVGAEAFIIDPYEHILLVRGPFWKYTYMVPGGTVEFGEDIFDTLVREVKEEVGLTVKPRGVLVVAQDVMPKDNILKKHYIYFNILCSPISKNVKIDNYEVKDYSWVKVERAAKLVKHPVLKRTISTYIKQKAKGKLNFIDIY